MLLFLYPFLLNGLMFSKRKKGKNKRRIAPLQIPREVSTKLQQRQIISSATRKIPTCCLVSAQCRRARCARNHRKPGSSAACVPASSPHALKFARKNLWCPASVCKTGRQTTHPTHRDSAKGPRHQRGRALRRHGRHGGLSPRILLHCHEPGM